MNKVLKLVKEKNPGGYHKFKALSHKIRLYLIGVFLMAIVLLSLLALAKSRGFRIDMLYVGQGDGIYVQSKENVSFFIDGGSSSESELARYTLLPYLKSMGVGHIDYWFLTHLDSDHISGFVELLEDGYDVKNLCVSKVLKGSPDFEKIKKLCDKNETKINYLVPGNRIGTDSMNFEVVYPKYPPEFEGANENSMVLFLDYENFEALFTGDMGIDQEDALLKTNRFKEILKKNEIEVLKVAHHGSKSSSCEEFLEAVSPEYAIISAGENNRYGHPSPETIDRLNRAGIKWISTIEAGRIRILYKNNKPEVKYFNE